MSRRPTRPLRRSPRYLADSGNHTRNIIGAYLWVLGGLAFLGFVAGLRGVLRRAEGEPGTLSSLVFGAGVVFTAVWSVSAAALAAVAYAVEFADAPVSDPDLVRVLPQLASAASPARGWFRRNSPACWRLPSSSSERVSSRAGSHGSGSSSRSLLVFDVTYMNIVPLLAWVVGASIVLLRRRRDGNRCSPGEPVRRCLTRRSQRNVRQAVEGSAVLALPSLTSGVRRDCLNLDLASERQRVPDEPPAGPRRRPRLPRRCQAIDAGRSGRALRSRPRRRLDLTRRL